MTRSIGVALIGQRFMGRAHSNAYGQVGRFFDPPVIPEKVICCGKDADALSEFAGRWGWGASTVNWKRAVNDPRVGLVDICTPNHLHAKPALEALRLGKHVACEKPLAGTLEEARTMRDAARKARKKTGARTFVWFNYRRCPAVGLAWHLIREGRIGAVRHVRATYLQSWGGPDTPMSWRFRRGQAGSGAHGDLNAHLVDMARFLLGQEVTEVHGAVARTFVRDRKEPGRSKKVRSNVDDALLFLATFDGGAVASFEASRVAAPHQNACSIEIDGSKGSLRFDFEDMNLLHFHDAADGAREGGWRRIICTSAEGHPYAKNWWPDAHLIGYEHGFTNMLSDVLRVIGRRKPELPLADFEDAYLTQRVLTAALIAASERRAVKINEVR